jgi:nitroimidazol reductase NimA-like FMN-containing flavoprotein (pyridoxamine 5'-phosphate oxidase superfamily)
MATGPAREPASERVQVRRGSHRAEYRPDRIGRILDAGLVAHVGITTPDGPVVLPMAYGHDDGHLYLHGAVGNALLRAAVGHEVCATVTVVDGLVVARTPFHDSMNYRSVVVRGVATEVTDATAKVRALRLVVDHVVDHWAAGRPPTAEEVRRTKVLALPLREASAKVRTGDPGDEPADLAGPHWGGSVPLRRTWAEPVGAAGLAPGTLPPPAIAALAGQPAEGTTTQEHDADA